jgi:hypothetical protein
MGGLVRQEGDGAGYVWAAQHRVRLVRVRPAKAGW